MSLSIQVENIKCGGCANSIKKGLMDEASVSTVEIDIDLCISPASAVESMSSQGLQGDPCGDRSMSLYIYVCE